MHRYLRVKVQISKTKIYFYMIFEHFACVRFYNQSFLLCLAQSLIDLFNLTLNQIGWRIGFPLVIQISTWNIQWCFQIWICFFKRFLFLMIHFLLTCKFWPGSDIHILVCQLENSKPKFCFGFFAYNQGKLNGIFFYLMAPLLLKSECCNPCSSSLSPLSPASKFAKLLMHNLSFFQFRISRWQVLAIVVSFYHLCHFI